MQRMKEERCTGPLWQREVVLNGHLVKVPCARRIGNHQRIATPQQFQNNNCDITTRGKSPLPQESHTFRANDDRLHSHHKPILPMPFLGTRSLVHHDDHATEIPYLEAAETKHP